MKSRHYRMLGIGAVLAAVGIGATFLLQAMNENILFYYSPTQVADGEPPEDRRFRVGGLVVNGSVQRDPGDLEVRFTLTDMAHNVPVVYAGVLPDLVREGQGINAHGTLNVTGDFVADDVLAKHDVKYLPHEVEDSLQAVHGEGG